MEKINYVTEQLEYRYQNAPIPGGGYVTGFVFEPAVKGMLYLRTDIGGAYRFDPQDQRWKSRNHAMAQFLRKAVAIAR